MIGVYAIRHKESGKVYVGSAVDIENRWSVHKAELKAGRHHNARLQRAWLKYGSDGFEFGVIELCTKSQLAVREQFWMDALKAVDQGYNLQPIARTPLGSKHSASTKTKLANSARRVAADPDERLRRSERARLQHAAGKLGQATWKSGTAQAIGEKNRQSGRLRWGNNYVARKASLQTADRTRQRALLKQLPPEEMSRRSKCKAAGKVQT